MNNESAAKRSLGNRKDNEFARREACIALADSALTFIEGHDDAIIGVSEIEGEFMVVYDQAKIINKLRMRDGMDHEGAIEFFQYNIAARCSTLGSPIMVARAK